jgi:hypothetical protein
MSIYIRFLYYYYYYYYIYICFNPPNTVYKYSLIQ